MDYKKRIFAQIIKFYAKAIKKKRVYKEDTEGLSAFDIYFNKIKVNNIIAKNLKKRTYHIRPPLERNIRIGKKIRNISSYTSLDNIVLSTIYELIAEHSESFISKNVYSYIRGRSAKQAVRAFTTYVKKKFTAKTHRDLFIFRGDITGYTDNIPVCNSSLIWKYIDQVLQTINFKNENEKKYASQIVEAALRPTLKTKENCEYQKLIGLPTGNQMSTLAANLYLRELDNMLIKLPDVFYARFGDDFLFACEDIHTFIEAEKNIFDLLKILGLKCNSKKNQRFYYTKAGKEFPQTETTPFQFTGCHQINYLGYLIYANGDTTPTNTFLRKLVSYIKLRIQNHANLFKNHSLELKGKYICQCVNNILDSKNTFSSKQIKSLLEKTTNQGLLKELDYTIALTISECISGIKGPRAWRVISYKTIREEWKLHSLCTLKIQQYKQYKNTKEKNCEKECV